MANLDTTGLRTKLGAAAVVLLASAPIIVMALRLFCYFSQTEDRETSLALYEVEMFLIRLTLFLLVFSLFRKRITGTILTAALWGAALLSQKENIDALLHGDRPWEISTPHPLAGDPSLFINPVPVMYCAVALIALMTVVSVKRLRSLDRLYVISIGAFVLSTTAIFHTTLQGGLQEILQTSPRMVKSSASEPVVCVQRGYDCMPTIRHDGKDMTFSARRIDIDPTVNGQLTAYAAPQPVNFLNLIDAKNVPQMAARFRSMFATLSIPVHAAWIFASLIGLALHKRNLARRMREQRTIDDYVEKRFYEFIQG